MVCRHYVCGFAFDDCNCVLLVEKLKPERQRMRWNGVGGKVEPHERERAYPALVAMQRAFLEETGVDVPAKKWMQFVRYDEAQNGGVDEHCIHFFLAHVGNISTPERNDAGEKLYWWPVSKLPFRAIDNLRWLIPLALDKYVKHDLPPIHIRAIGV